MVTRRIIPCLDVLNGRVVKGKQFVSLVDVGDPVELALQYSEEGADEIVLLDISATIEERRPFFDIVKRTARSVAVPLTVGGGVRTLEDILELLRVGADKVSCNTILTENPSLVTEAAKRVGSQALVAAIDVRRKNGSWTIARKSGKEHLEIDAIKWAKTLVEYGVGEILATSIDCDGMKGGYDLELLSTLSHEVTVPVIASGGAGTKEHMRDALTLGNADAVLAASMFHFKELEIHELKEYLSSQGIAIRL